jgi:hypothetical protein
MTPEQFFLVEATRYARTLSYCDTLLFLRGLLLLAGDAPEVADLRDALRSMEGGDQQLKLIADPQAKLNLEDGKKPGGDGNGK